MSNIQDDFPEGSSAHLVSRNKLAMRLLLSAAIAVLPSACTPREASDGLGHPQYSIEDFLESTTYTSASFSPDNQHLLVGSDASGIFNAYALPVAGGEPAPLTHSTTDAIFPVDYFADGERFLFSSDQGGNELSHLYVQDPDGTITDLTPGEGFLAAFMRWAGDDQSFFVRSNERDERFFDVWEYAVNGYDRKLVFENTEAYQIGPVSQTGDQIALVKHHTTLNSDLFLWERGFDRVIHLTPHEGDIAYRPTEFGPLDGTLYYLTDEGSEYTYLKRYVTEGRRHETVIDFDWDISYASFSHSGKYLVVGVNNDARTESRLYDPETMTPIALPSLPNASVMSAGFSRDETVMGLFAGSSRGPGDVFVRNMDGGELRQLTHSLNNAIDADALVDGEVVRFASYDGVEIPGILYKPHTASETNKVPALVWVHGGPGGQSRVGYSSQIQYFVNHGYAVYAINNRGSSGYGKTFYAMDDRKHGDADLDDCVASKEMLIRTGWVDPDRIGIIGGSYGGYLTLAALTFRPEEFALGVDLFGISNWHRTLNSMPSWWTSERDALEQEMGDFDDEEFFTAKSPLFHAEQIVKPLMVLQGANDPRVLQVESDQIVEAVRATGVPVEYVLFDDEGHGFIKRENQAESSQRILAFLDAHL